MSKGSIWPIDRTLLGATSSGQSEPGSNDNEGVLHILQSFSITGASPSDCLVSYPEHLLDGSSSSAEKQSVYSTAPSSWAKFLKSFCTWLYDIKYPYLIQIIWKKFYLTDGILTSTTTFRHSEPGCYGNEGVTPHSSDLQM